MEIKISVCVRSVRGTVLSPAALALPAGWLFKRSNLSLDQEGLRRLPHLPTYLPMGEDAVDIPSKVLSGPARGQNQHGCSSVVNCCVSVGR